MNNRDYNLVVDGILVKTITLSHHQYSTEETRKSFLVSLADNLSVSSSGFQLQRIIN